VLATRLTVRCLDWLIEQAQNKPPGGAFIGVQSGKIQFFDLEDFPRMVDFANNRPKEQWWMDLRTIAHVMAQPNPQIHRQKRKSTNGF
jgi:6-phosphofructokinase 1